MSIFPWTNIPSESVVDQISIDFHSKSIYLVPYDWELYSEAYSDLSRTSKMEFFAKITSGV